MIDTSDVILPADLIDLDVETKRVRGRLTRWDVSRRFETFQRAESPIAMKMCSPSQACR
jgi:hypothetical protein